MNSVICIHNKRQVVLYILLFVQPIVYSSTTLEYRITVYVTFKLTHNNRVTVVIGFVKI